MAFHSPDTLPEELDFEERFLNIPVQQWLNENYFLETLVEIPNNFEDEDSLFPVLSPFALEEMRAKLHKCVGDNWEQLSTLGIRKCELFSQPSLGTLEEGYLWIPKIDQQLKQSWAKKQGRSTIAILGREDTEGFKPLCSLLIRQYIDGQKLKYPQFLSNLKDGREGYAFEVSFANLSLISSDDQQQEEMLCFSVLVVFTGEMIVPLQRTYHATLAFTAGASPSIKEAVLRNIPEYITPSDAFKKAQEVTVEVLLTLNESQRSAIRNAVETMYAVPAVQIIKGPPGTGKTKTLVGLLRILVHAGLRVHVCAPTNAAIGELAKRFFQVLEQDRLLLSKNFRRAFATIITRRKDGADDDNEANDAVDGGVEANAAPVEELLPYDFDARMERIKSTAVELPQKILMIVNGLTIFEEGYRGVGQSVGDSQVASDDGKHPDPKHVANTNCEALKDAINRFQIFCDECPGPNDEICVVDMEKYLLRWKDKLTTEYLESLFQCQLTRPPDCPNRIAANAEIEDLRRFCQCIVHGISRSSAPVVNEAKLRHAIFNAARVVFSTVNVGGRSLFGKGDFDFVIIDEASQSVFAETLIVLEKTEDHCQVVLAGDEQQLPATIFSQHGKRLGFDRSLMERLIDAGYPKTLLNVQYRMHPHISRWPNVSFYDGEVIDGDNVIAESYAKSWHVKYPPFSVLHVVGREESIQNSFSNVAEQDVVRLLVTNFRGLDESMTIGVISPYRMQIKALKGLEKQHGTDGTSFAVRVATVDSFQGQECDVIIFSAVRANDTGAVGFVRDYRRINVALTRAKYCLIVVCNATTMRSSQLWKSLLSHARMTNAFFAGGSEAYNASAVPSSNFRRREGLSLIIRRSELRHQKHAEIVTSFMEAAQSACFEYALWKLWISNDFKKSVGKVSHGQRKSLIETLLRLVNGHWPKHYQATIPVAQELKDVVFIFILGSNRPPQFFLWSVDIDKHQRGQILKVWDIGTREEILKAVPRVNAHYLRFPQQYIRLCSERCAKQEMEELHIFGSIRQLPGRKLICPQDFRSMDSDEFAAAFAYEKKAPPGSTTVTSVASITKFFSFNTAVAKFFLRSDEFSCIQLPFEMTPEEDQLVRNDCSMFILGRSGTGKTTVLLHRIYLIFTVMSAKDVVPRQLLITASQTLCNVISRTYDDMVNTAAKMSEAIMENTPAKALVIKPTSMDSAAGAGGAESKRSFDDPTSNDGKPWIMTSFEFLRTLDQLLTPPFLSKMVMKEPITLERFQNVYFPRFSEGSRVRQADLIYTEIMSTIKGSLRSLRTDKGYLTKQEYVNMQSRRDSTLNEVQREAIYGYFVTYERLKTVNMEYDLMDLIFYIYTKLTTQEHALIPMDYVYVDEVQDLVPAQIALFKFVCSQLNGYTFAGDTAQTIANGVGFRFETVKDIFYQEFIGSEPLGDKVPKIWHLIENFRTHTGVIKLANSIVQLILKIFPSTIDKLPPESSRIEGPAPILVNAVDEEIQECLTMNLGADQVILVRDDETRDALYAILGKQKALILTVFEAKGMEFADCLIYNFFTSSPLQDDWRVLYNWTDTTKAKPVFDHQRHERLCVELKKLYVLITRAKQHLVVMETERKWREPMFGHWMNEDIVTVVEKFDSNLKQIFSALSSAEEWNARGEEFFERRQFANAKLCFERGGNDFRAALCDACETEVMAEKESALNATKAQDLYCIAGEKYANLNFHVHAARCFRRGFHYDKAAEQYLMVDDHAQAAVCFESASMLKRAAKEYAIIHDLSGASRCCFGIPDFRYLEDELFPIFLCNGMVEACEVEKVRAEIIRKGALYYHFKKKKSAMLEFVQRFSSTSMKRAFLKRYGYYDQLLEMELNDGRFEEVGIIYEQRRQLKQAAEMYMKVENKSFDAMRCLVQHLQRCCVGDRLMLCNHESETKLCLDMIDALFAANAGNFSDAFVKEDHESHKLVLLELEVYQHLAANRLSSISTVTSLLNSCAELQSDAMNFWALRFALYRCIFLHPPSAVSAEKEHVRDNKGENSNKNVNKKKKKSVEKASSAAANVDETKHDDSLPKFESHTDQLKALKGYLALIREIMSMVNELLRLDEVNQAKNNKFIKKERSDAPVSRLVLTHGANAMRLQQLLRIFGMEAKELKNGADALHCHVTSVISDLRVYEDVLDGSTTLREDHYVMTLKELLLRGKRFILRECLSVVLSCTRMFAKTYFAQFDMIEERLMMRVDVLDQKRGSIPYWTQVPMADVWQLINSIEEDFVAIVGNDSTISDLIDFKEVKRCVIDATKHLESVLYLPMRNIVNDFSQTVIIRQGQQQDSCINKMRGLLTKSVNEQFRQPGMMYDAQAKALLCGSMLGPSHGNLAHAWRLSQILQTEWCQRKWDPKNQTDDSRHKLIHAMIWEYETRYGLLPNWPHGYLLYGLLQGADTLCQDWKKGGLHQMKRMTLETNPNENNFWRKDGCWSPRTFTKLVEKYAVLLLLYSQQFDDVIIPEPLAVDVLCRWHPTLVQDIVWFQQHSTQYPGFQDLVWRATEALKNLLLMILELLMTLNYEAFCKWHEQAATARGCGFGEDVVEPRKQAKTAYISFLDAMISLILTRLASLHPQNVFKKEICIKLGIARRKEKTMLHHATQPVPFYLARALQTLTESPSSANVNGIAKYFQDVGTPLVALHVKHGAPPVRNHIRALNIPRKVLQSADGNCVDIVDMQLTDTGGEDMTAVFAAADQPEEAADWNIVEASHGVEEEREEILAALPPPPPLEDWQEDVVDGNEPAGKGEGQGDEGKWAVLYERLRQLGRQAKKRIALLSDGERLRRGLEKKMLRVGFRDIYRCAAIQSFVDNIVQAEHLLRLQEAELLRCEQVILRIPEDERSLEAFDWIDQLQDAREHCSELRKTRAPPSPALLHKLHAASVAEAEKTDEKSWEERGVKDTRREVSVDGHGLTGFGVEVTREVDTLQQRVQCLVMQFKTEAKQGKFVLMINTREAKKTMGHKDGKKTI